MGAAALERLGGFDESFFLHGEETDWERRAVADGWSLVLAEDQVTTHVGGGGRDEESRREIPLPRRRRTIHSQNGSGPRAWASYRLATVLGAALRVVRLPGVSRHVVHVVLTDNFAGTERYLATVAAGLIHRGWKVTVVGGPIASMRQALGPGIDHRAVNGVGSAVRRLARCRSVDILHAHLTAAESAAALSTPFLRAPVVATRHIAARRGSRLPGRILAPFIWKPEKATDVDFVGFISDPSDLLDRSSVFWPPGRTRHSACPSPRQWPPDFQSWPPVPALNLSYSALADGRFRPGDSRKAGELLRILADRPDVALTYRPRATGAAT